MNKGALKPAQAGCRQRFSPEALMLIDRSYRFFPGTQGFSCLLDFFGMTKVDIHLLSHLRVFRKSLLKGRAYYPEAYQKSLDAAEDGQLRLR